MEHLKIACGIIAWIALCLGACAFEVWIISKCPKEDNGDYVEPNEGK